MANVLIIGASHGIGLETVRAALRAGHSVRALARSATGIPIQDANLTKVSGNALDPDTIRNVLRGIDVVIQTLGVDFSPRLVFEGTRLFSESTRILVDAMKAAGVKRLITVTGLGAGDSRGHGGLLYDAIVFPLFLKPVYDDKDVQEWIARSLRARLDDCAARTLHCRIGTQREGPMGMMIVRHKVRDYGQWRPIFDQHAEMQSAAGLINPRVYHSADSNKSEIVVVFDTEDTNKAKDFAASADLKEAMEKAGVLDAPTIYFLESID